MAPVQGQWVSLAAVRGLAWASGDERQELLQVPTVRSLPWAMGWRKGRGSKRNEATTFIA